MIKAIILDVDGVIVGNKKGFNFPLPHLEVISYLKKLHAKGVSIVLCTAKFGFAIKQIALDANLKNPHITDGGALIIDFVDNTIIKEYQLNKKTAIGLTSNLISQNFYTEIYTAKEYYMQKDQVNEFTTTREHLLQKPPRIVPDLHIIIDQEDIIKVIVFAPDDSKMPQVDAICKNYEGKLQFIWSSHPFLKPVRPGIITAPGVSKEHAVKEVVSYLNVSFDEILGIGDTKSDWNFMKLCKYVATLENGDDEIKKLVATKGEGHYFISPSVDEHGIIPLIEYFLKK